MPGHPCICLPVNSDDETHDDELEPFSGVIAGEDARTLMERYFRWGGRDVETDLRFFSTCPGGVAISSMRLCLMARPVGVGSYGDIGLIPERNSGLKACNAWFIHYMGGDLSALPELVPGWHSLPFVTYVRGSRFDMRTRVIPIERFSARIHCIFSEVKSSIH